MGSVVTLSAAIPSGAGVFRFSWKQVRSGSGLPVACTLRNRGSPGTHCPGACRVGREIPRVAWRGVGVL